MVKSSIEIIISHVTGIFFDLFFCFLHRLNRSYLPRMMVRRSYNYAILEREGIPPHTDFINDDVCSPMFGFVLVVVMVIWQELQSNDVRFRQEF